MNKKTRAYKRGLWAEALAALYLRCRGYRVLARRYKTPLGEIDLIARRKDTIIIVEVKTRGLMDSALESVDERSRGRIERAARHFIAANPRYADYNVRFDIIAFAPPFALRHLDNAWQAHT